MKNPNWWFFCLNMNLNMCRDYTIFFSKIAITARRERKFEVYRFSRLFWKVLNLEKRQIFKFSFPPCGDSDFGNFFYIVSTHTKLHVQAKKSAFWIFHRVHIVSVSLPCSVKWAKLNNLVGKALKTFAMKMIHCANNTRLESCSMLQHTGKICPSLRHGHKKNIFI